MCHYQTFCNGQTESRWDVFPVLAAVLADEVNVSDLLFSRGLEEETDKANY